MHEYVSFVLTLAREDGALALAVAALVLAGAGIFCLIRRRRFPRVRAPALALLSGYLAALANMTVTGRQYSVEISPSPRPYSLRNSRRSSSERTSMTSVNLPVCKLRNPAVRSPVQMLTRITGRCTAGS